MPYRIYNNEFEARGRNLAERAKRQALMNNATDVAIYEHNMKLHPTDGRAALEIPTLEEWPEEDQANLVNELSADWTPTEDLL